ncbi:MAG: manganese efflux pump [Clostridia bacterium]|nr:manganese efflux pump [Clostridia bacterium]
MGFSFFLHSILFGIALAMDAFSVSLANGLNQPCMKKSRMCFIAGIFSFFQCIMPLIGWVCVHTIAIYFKSFQKFIPWIALALLLFIGGKMLIEGIKNDCENEECCCKRLGITALLVQGIATSIDALSVGFEIAHYNTLQAVVCGIIIAAVTFAICMGGLVIGRKAGTKLSGKANVLGGCILIIIGLEIFITGII